MRNAERSKRPYRSLAAAAAAALLILLWLLHRDAPPDASIPQLAPEQTAEVGAPPIADLLAPVPVPIEAPPARWRDDLGEAVNVVGRIIGPDGAPIAGAEIRNLPSYRLQLEMELVQPRMLSWTSHAGPVEGIPLEILPATVTDADGRFDLAARLLPTDRARGFGAVAPVGILVRADGWTSRDLELGDVPGDLRDLGDIALEPEAVLTGRVVDESGQPLASALVRRIFAWPKARDGAEVSTSFIDELCVTRTGADGRFHLAGQWPGDVELALRASGFVPIEVPLHPKQAGLLDAGDIVLRRGGVIEGLVVDAAGRPVPGAEILLTDDPLDTWTEFDWTQSFKPSDDALPWQLAQLREDEWRGLARSGPDGRFRAEGLIGKAQSLYVSAPGFEPSRQTDVALGSSNVRIALAREASLVVSVRDEASGELLPDAKVRARRLMAPGTWQRLTVPLEVASGAVAHAACPDSDFPPGRRLVRGVGAAQTWLTVEAPGHGTRSLLEAGHPAGSSSNIDVALGREAVLRGQVHDERGVAVAGARVRWTGGPEPCGSQESVTDGTGTWHIAGLPQGGAGTVQVDHTGFVSVWRSEIVPAADGLSEALEFVLPRASDLRGRLLDADGRPLARRKVECRTVELAARQPDNTWRPDSDITDEAGTFLFRQMPLGRYLLKAKGDGETEVTLEAGGTADVEIRKPRSPRVVGRVTRGGEPVAGLYMSFSMGSDEPERSWFFPPDDLRTDADGRFGVWLPDPGTYRLTLSGGRDKPLQRLVDVAAEGLTHCDIELPSHRIAGVVVSDVDGSPIGGLPLTLAQAEREVETTQTAPDGSFEFVGASPGTWLVRSTAVWHAPPQQWDIETSHEVTGRPARARTRYCRPFQSEIIVEQGPSPWPVRLTACTGATLLGRVTRADGSLATEPLRVELVHFTPDDAIDSDWRPDVHLELPQQLDIHCVEVREGSYEATALPPGMFRVRVVARDARPSQALDVVDHGAGLRLAEHETRTLDLVAPER